MSEWTHSICEDCWDKEHPERKAHRLSLGDEAMCCYCGTIHNSGIYVREDPDKLPCKGVHTRLE
jgi:hypothetical protein